MNYSLEELKNHMLQCQACDLYKSRTQVVFGEGNSNPIFMIISEGPGENEDIQGKPFVGKCGEKLDRILQFIGVTRDQIYISNSILCHTPNNRLPAQEELDACRWRLYLQIKLLKPKFIVALGKVALLQLLGKPIKGALNQYFKHNGAFFNINGENIKGIVSYHPSYLLRNPGAGD